MSKPTSKKRTSLQKQWQEQWQAIEDAGGRYQYVQQQLKAQGFMLERRPIDSMTASERERYKKQLKAEAAARKQLKKDTWQAYKAHHIVHLGHGVYWTDDQSDDKYDIKDRQNRLIENGLPVFKNPQALASALGLTIPRLKGLCYQADVATCVPYTHFTITKRSGADRQIWAPIPMLKTVQRFILSEILNNLPIHGSSHGFIQGKSVLTNAKPHSDSRILIKLDIKDFFPTVSFRRVKGVFRQAGYQEQIATLLALLCTESPRDIVKHDGTTYYVSLGKRCLPQGAPTSPALSNVVCLQLDRRLTGLAVKHGLRYSRYADDLTFSVPQNTKASDEELVKLIPLLLGSVSKILSEEGFVLHSQKSTILRQGAQQAVTGLVVNDKQEPRSPRHIKRMLRSALHNLEQGKPLPENETMERLMGYVAWVGLSEPEKGRALLSRLQAVAKSKG